MHRRRFLESTALTALSAALPSTTSLAFGSDALEPFEWATDDLTLAFEFSTGRLRQKQLLPKDVVSISKSSGVEVALQCSGENSPDQGMKSGMGQPGARLLFAGRHEESTDNGKRLVCSHTDPKSGLRVESIYQAFAGVPVVRRYTRVTNTGTSPA